VSALQMEDSTVCPPATAPEVQFSQQRFWRHVTFATTGKMRLRLNNPSLPEPEGSRPKNASDSHEPRNARVRPSPPPPPPP